MDTQWQWRQQSQSHFYFYLIFIFVLFFTRLLYSSTFFSVRSFVHVRFAFLRYFFRFFICVVFIPFGSLTLCRRFGTTRFRLKCAVYGRACKRYNLIYADKTKFLECPLFYDVPFQFQRNTFRIRKKWKRKQKKKKV